MSSKFKQLFDKEMSRKDFLSIGALATIALLGVGGVIEELLSHASTPYSSTSASKGTLTGNAKSLAITGAASGNAVEFETPTATATPLPSKGGKVIMGSYSNYDDVSAHTSFMEDIGITNVASTCMLDFINNDSWSACWSTYSGQGDFAAFPGIKMYGVAMAMSNDFRDWGAVTGGAQDANYKAMFQWCITNNIHLIRMGWEFTDGWPPWGVGGIDTTANQQGFIACWQHIVNLARSVSGGSAFQFVFNPDCGVASYFADWTNYYPGDAYVDIIGVDVYDKIWSYTSTWSDSYYENLLNNVNPPTMPQIVAFANAHGKILALPEWGTYPFSNTANTNCAPGNDPAFAKARMDWAIAQAQAGQTVYMVAWNTSSTDPSDGSMHVFPDTLAQLKASVVAGIASGDILN